MLNEFEIIEQYFNPHLKSHPEIIQGIGDDAAVWQVEGATLVTSVDTLVEGQHFFSFCTPEDLAYKALAVNLSDFAAMGAVPRWFTLALTLPTADANWLEKFSKSLHQLAAEYNLALIGGDTTQGPLTVTIQIIGTADKNKLLLRSGAKVGDAIYVSGTLGDAGLALQYLSHKITLPKTLMPAILQAFNRPQPQVALGLSLGGRAHAAIDISDGLAQDLSHILQKSGVGALIHLEQLPLSDALTQVLGRDAAEQLALTAGDDYQLCFTGPKGLEAENMTCIGEITQESGLRIYRNNALYTGSTVGFSHFGTTY